MEKILNRSDPEDPQIGLTPRTPDPEDPPRTPRVVLRGLGSSNAPRLPGGGGGDVTSLPDLQGVIPGATRPKDDRPQG